MWIDKLKSLIRPESAEPPSLHELCPAGDFLRVLQQERCSADQTGHEFSLLVFEFNDNPPDNALVQKLWQVIYLSACDAQAGRRVRQTDKVGWLSSRSLGVILPEMPFADSRRVAEEVCRMLEAAMPLVSYKILTYPPQQDISRTERGG